MFEAAVSLDPLVPKKVSCESTRVCIRGHVRVCASKQGVCVCVCALS